MPPNAETRKGSPVRSSAPQALFQEALESHEFNFILKTASLQLEIFLKTSGRKPYFQDVSDAKDLERNIVQARRI
jgi:hypothetical protein